MPRPIPAAAERRPCPRRRLTWVGG